MLLYCIRHGETDYNAEGRLQGHLNISLSSLGRRQVCELARLAPAWRAEALYCSPLQRARETAEPIAELLGLPIREEPRLIEIDVGCFQGLTRPDLDREFPDDYGRWRSGDPDYAAPQGESRRALMARGRAALEEIACGPEQRVIVVSHGAILAAAFKSLLEIPAGRHPFVLENASVSKLEINGPIVRLLTLNEIGHLEGLNSAGSGEL